MLLENDRGLCPWCKQGTAFRQVHQVHYATPKYAAGGYTFKHKKTGVVKSDNVKLACNFKVS